MPSNMIVFLHINIKKKKNTTDDEGERSENKLGENISLCTVVLEFVQTE